LSVIKLFFKGFLGFSAKRSGRPASITILAKVYAKYLVFLICFFTAAGFAGFLNFFSEVKSVLFELLVGFFFAGAEKRFYC
jgi:hypothetical protein